MNQATLETKSTNSNNNNEEKMHDFYNKKEHNIQSSTPIIKKERLTTKATKYRSKVQIMYDIMLPLSKFEGVKSLHYNVEYDGLTQTQIMYKSTLSYAQLKPYVAGLMADDLIELNKKNNRFKLTPKGFNFIKIYDELAELMPSIKSVYY